MKIVMIDEHQPFDDPQLKATLRRIEGGEKAPAALRESLVKQLAQQPSAKSVFSAHSRRWIAAAAMVLLVIGGVTGYRHYREVQEERAEYANNTSLLLAMVAMQDAGPVGTPDCKLLTSSLSDSAALAGEARSQLNRSIPVVNLNAQGWKIDAASTCGINTFPSIRLHFSRANQSLTFVSIPSSAYADADDGNHYEIITDKHPIAGYVKCGSLNCVVGDPSLSLAEITSLRDLIKGG